MSEIQDSLRLVFAIEIYNIYCPKVQMAILYIIVHKLALQSNSSLQTPRLSIASLNDRIKEDTLVVNNLEYIIAERDTEVKRGGN